MVCGAHNAAGRSFGSRYVRSFWPVCASPVSVSGGWVTGPPDGHTPQPAGATAPDGHVLIDVSTHLTGHSIFRHSDNDPCRGDVSTHLTGDAIGTCPQPRTTPPVRDTCLTDISTYLTGRLVFRHNHNGHSRSPSAHVDLYCIWYPEKNGRKQPDYF